MAITLIERPVKFIYDESPGGEYYSKWNSCGKFDRINYIFNIQENDLQSRLKIDLREFGSDKLLASNFYRPFKVGNFIVDVSAYVRGYLYSEYSNDLANTNNTDLGCSIRFYIEYTQVFENGSSAFQSDKINPIHAVHSANSIGDENGSNLKLFVPISADIEDKAKFLTSFDVPVLFEGYPLSLSFIFDNSLGGKEVFLNQNELDINKNSIAVNEFQLDASKINRVNIVNIQDLTESNTSFIQVNLSTGNDLNYYYVDEGYVDEGYTQIR